MNLEADDAFAEFLVRIGQINDLFSVQLGNDVIAVGGKFQVVPVVGFQGFFAVFGWGCYPAAATALVEAAGMFADARVNFNLHAFNVGAVLGVDSGDFGA